MGLPRFCRELEESARVRLCLFFFLVNLIGLVCTEWSELVLCLGDF